MTDEGHQAMAKAYIAFGKDCSETAWQMNRNLVGSIYGRSSIKIGHFIPIHQQTWPPQEVGI
jgi:hypothetical protein